MVTDQFKRRQRTLPAGHEKRNLIEGLLGEFTEGHTKSRQHWGAQRIRSGELGNQVQTLLPTPVNLCHGAGRIDDPILLESEFSISPPPLRTQTAVYCTTD